MFRRLGLLCAALACFSLAGGHWAVLQTVAWTGMLHDYTRQSGSLAVAVAHTFDGQHPCELCRAIAAAKSESHDPSSAAPAQKKDFPVKALLAGSVPGPASRTPVGVCPPRAAAVCGPGRTEAPPTPPPRRAALAA